jgi:hypothetical protein
MFRAIAALKKSEGFQNSSTDFIDTQTKRFQQPNPILGSLTKILDTNNINLGLQTWDPNTRQPSMRDIDIQTLALQSQESQEIQRLRSECEKAQINNIATPRGQTTNLRCGWIYKKGVPGNIPEVSQGALGTRNGPLNYQNNPPGKWYWDINEAKKVIEIDRCSALASCMDVANTSFEGCAFSTERGIGIPVNPNGSLKYPEDSRFSGALGKLITANIVTQCPKIPAAAVIPADPESPIVATSSTAGRDTCIPDSNGRLPRDCYLDKILLAGCSDTGSLYTALSSSMDPNNYFGNLTDQMAYKKYQQLAKSPLMETTLKSGQASASTALQNFQVLKSVSISDQNSALSFSARDLCLKQGIMDQFDFCTELTSTTLAPFSLECLQKAFKQAGGQETGIVYPSQNNILNWNQFGTWGNVLNKINQLKQNINSTREEIQRDAIANFLGIRRAPYEMGQIGRIPGIEVFWFNRGTNTFIGRRLTGGLAAQFPKINTREEVEKTGLGNNVEYLSMVNLRPLTDQSIKLQIRSDDGFMYAKNKIFSPTATRGQILDTKDLFGVNKDQTPTTFEQKSCWDLKAGGPNYINGYWQESGGGATFELAYSPCNQTSWQTVPPEWMSLTQEPDAPMLSWQVDQDGVFQERRIPYFFELNIVGGTVSDRNIIGYPYLKELKLGSRSAYAKLMKNVAFNSWRSLSISFFASENTSGSATGFLLFKLGEAITVRILGKNVIVSVNTATLNVNKTFTNVIDNNNIIPNYFFINCKRDSGQNQDYPNRITFAVGTMAAFYSGNISIETAGNNMATYTTTGNQPVFTATDSAELSLGDSSGVSSAICTIGSLRMFDYQMENSDIQRDIKNEWKMNFI